MRILLISPLLIDEYLSMYKSKVKAFFHRIIAKSTYHMSLSLHILAELTPKEYEVDIVKDHYSKIDIDPSYDLVGIRTTTPDSPYAYMLADAFREKGVKVVLGGWHASALPYEAKQHADSVVVGEAEEIWPELLKDFEKGKLKPFYFQNRPVDPGKIPILKNHRYKWFLPAVQATRGCPYQCSFCSETIMRYRRVFRKRPIDDVIKEIGLIKEKTFIFHDASLTIDTEYTKELFRRLKDLNKKFFCNGNVNVLGRDEELLRLANEAGCVGWLVGFESIRRESLESVGKIRNKVNEYIRTIERVHDHGMMVSGSFMFGLDGDTIDVFDQTREFVERSGIDLPDAMILTPFPGTPIFKRFEKEGRILTRDWRKYDHRHVVFKPLHMEPDELFYKTKEIFENYFSIPNILSRSIRSMSLGFFPFVSTFFQNITMATMELFY